MKHRLIDLKYFFRMPFVRKGLPRKHFLCFQTRGNFNFDTRWTVHQHLNATITDDVLHRPKQHCVLKK